MAVHLDFEEQEQLDRLKHFWSRYGNAITWVLIVVLGAFAAYNGWNYWKRTQAAEAAVMYDEVERAAQAADLARLERALADIQQRYASTTYAQQAALLAASTLHAQQQADKAQAALGWAAAHGPDDGLRAVARLRLAGQLMQAGQHEQALQRLASEMPDEFTALAADRRGDIYLAQGKTDEAKAQYLQALAGLQANQEYRLLVEVKLNALGGQAPQAEAAK